jgi:hypothetical protein
VRFSVGDGEFTMVASDGYTVGKAAHRLDDQDENWAATVPRALWEAWLKRYPASKRHTGLDVTVHVDADTIRFSPDMGEPIESAPYTEQNWPGDYNRLLTTAHADQPVARVGLAQRLLDKFPTLPNQATTWSVFERTESVYTPGHYSRPPLMAEITNGKLGIDFEGLLMPMRLKEDG